LISTSLSVDNRTERVDAEMVSGNYFSMLGVKAELGRVFSSEEDDRVYQGHPVVVLSHSYWTSRFARDPNIVGKKVLVNNYPMTVIGVSAAGFVGLDPAQSPHIRVPILMKPVIAPEWAWLKVDDRRARWVQVFARLKPGYTMESAKAPLQGLFHQIREYEMSLPAAAKWSAYNREQFMKGSLEMEKAATGFSSLRNDFSSALLVLMCMVGLVLMIACANVANLLIARALSRQKEVSLRLSLGASRAQLVRQLLMESMVLSVAGGLLGLVMAFTMTRFLLSLVPAEGNPLLIQPQPDGRILLFTLAVTIVTGLVFGLVPALRSTSPDLWTTLKDTVGSIAGTRGHSLFLRKGLITVQVALSFLLLFGAGLFVRSLQNLRLTNTGFDEMHNLVTFQLSPILNGYDEQRAVTFYRDVSESLRRVPGVKEAAFTGVPLLHGDEWDSSMAVEGHQAKDGEDMQAFMNSPSPAFFKTMGVPLVEGREFDARDIHKDSKVVIVNQRFARHFFGEQTAIGRHIGFGGGPGTKLDLEIIGVAADTLYEGPREGVRRQVFVPNFGNNSVTFYVRTSVDSKTTFQAIREAVKRLDASLPVSELKTLEGQLDETLLTARLIALLSAGFGLLATTLAAIGLYGVMAFFVGQRTKELGVRLALGAQRRSVIWLVMREVFILLSIGLIIGVPAAIGLGRFVSTQLYGIQGNDPWIAAAMVLLLTAAAVAAGFIPAHRASRIDPILALRFE
jgi:predicted permease